MNIKYAVAEPEPVVKEKVIINGHEIGQVWQKGYDYLSPGFYCSLLIPPVTIVMGQLFGEGVTREAAILDALEDGRKKAEAYTMAADWLNAELDKGEA